jgi:hypothetical protein
MILSHAEKSASMRCSQRASFVGFDMWHSSYEASNYSAAKTFLLLN